MKLICTQDNLKKAISSSERMVSKQNTLPILNAILFEADKGSLRLSATNLEMGIQIKIGAKVEKEGKIAVPAKLISNFSANLPEGESVSLELDEQNLKIKSGRTQATIKSFLAGDFPLIPKKTTESLFEINTDNFKKIINRIIVSVAHGEARQELSGVNIIFNKEDICFASTDSFRLTEYSFKLSDKNNINKDSYNAFIDKNVSIIIPAATLIEMGRIISNNLSDIIKVTLEEGQIFFEIGGARIVSRLINGKYPEYKHIMPTNFKTTIIGDKAQIQNAIKMASLFAPGKSSDITLKINQETGNVSIGARSAEAGENATEIDFEALGESQEIIFNSKYLLDGINMIESSKVALLANSETAPVAIKEVDQNTNNILEGYTYIVMPIKN
ncbi:MAG: DNA polymerase III subunit beta [Candidatus Moranbacteria bacterium]|nr:DNA polymerase III subunit beta [Candidatus Moranbacteria bacterium]